MNNQLAGSSTKSGSKSIIILDGTSSSGKSAIVKFFDSKTFDENYQMFKNKVIEKYPNYKI